MKKKEEKCCEIKKSLGKMDHIFREKNFYSSNIKNILLCYIIVNVIFYDSRNRKIYNFILLHIFLFMSSL